MGNVTAQTYNLVGQTTSQTDPLGNTAHSSYDSGDLLRVVDPLGRTTSRFLDSAGRVISVIDPLGKTTTYTYTPLGQVSTVVDDPPSRRKAFSCNSAQMRELERKLSRRIDLRL
jgi:YD repeat-containing protein